MMDIVELLERATRGAALLHGVRAKPTFSRLAELLGVERSQIGRWYNRYTQPTNAHYTRLLELAVVDEYTQNARGSCNLNNFAVDIKKLEVQRSKRQECRSCGTPIPSAMYRAGTRICVRCRERGVTNA